ncbi:MAG: hypothetical protein SCM96_08675 [Acidobacteriota bacterium]|nr:hypothetical protein [Acidobacteriota bacterium]
MDSLEIGRWVMIVLGAAVIVSVIVSGAHRNRNPVAMLLFGVLLLGIGTFGMEFMPRYSEWLKVIKAMVDSPSIETYQVFFDKVAEEKLPSEVADIGINFVVNHQVDGMEFILARAIAETPPESQGRRDLERTLEALRGRQAAVDQLLQAAPSPETAREFDSSMRELLYRSMRLVPPHKLQEFGIDPAAINQYKPPPKKRPQ